MKLAPCLHFTREMALRLVADALMIKAAVLVAMAIHFFFQMAFINPRVGAYDHNRIFWSHLGAYCKIVSILVPICALVFYMGGFYTRGRRYIGHYKALVITQAVSLSYLL